MTTAVAATVDPLPSVADLLQEKERTGKRALTAYQALQLRETHLLKESEECHTFCDNHGINLAVMIDKAEEEARPKAVAPSGKDATLIMTVATAAKDKGFSVEELFKAAAAEKIDTTTQEARQHLLGTVLDLKNAGSLKEEKRDKKTYYVIIPTAIT